MNISEHAKARMKQRGIAMDDLDFILQFGRNLDRPGGAKMNYLGKKEIKDIEKALKGIERLIKRNLQKLVKMKGAAAIRSENDDIVLTTYRKKRPPRNS